jgi:hypothetical protein
MRRARPAALDSPHPSRTLYAVRSHPRRTRALFALVVCSMAALVLFPMTLRATVEEQRARLPPPASCPDAVEGVWMSHKFDPRFWDWYVFTLRIRRSAPGAQTLVGDIQSHYWDGGPDDPQPPAACRPGMQHQTVFMTAQGIANNGRIEFWGTSWRPEQSLCGAAPVAGQYNLDHFSGTIDANLQEFQSVNNDGGRSINDPTVFRRIRCLDPGPAARLTIAPPPFAPPRHAAGCGGRP